MKPGPTALITRLATAPDGFRDTSEGKALAAKALALVEKTAPQDAEQFLVELTMLGYLPEECERDAG